MAAALQHRVAAPLPTPLTAFVPVIRGLGPRSFSNNTFTSESPGFDCANFDGFRTCSSAGDYGRCLATASASICGCSEGLEYLDCVSAAIATSSCWNAVGIADWDSYEREWIQDSCPTPASTVMALLPQPTSVQVELAPVNIVTPPASALPTTTNRASVAQPTSTFDGQGGILSQETCKGASYTLVEAGDVVYYAAVIGCMGDRPECCPWSVSVEGGPTTASFEGNRVAGGAGQFPIPASGIHALLARCPDDYYSISGQCCPNGYFKFTRKIAFQTPCFSSLSSRITPPVLTAGLAANPTNSRLPTSAILNVALAMSYNVTSDAPGLSKPAAIGIGVGAGVGALLLAAATALVCIRARRKKKEKQTPVAAHVTGQVEPRYQDHPGVAYQRGYNAPPGSPPMPSPPMPSPPVPSPPPVSTPSSYAPVAGHSRNFSDVSDGTWGGQYQGYQQGGGYDAYQDPFQGQQGYQGQEYQPQEYHGQQGYQREYQQDERFGGYHRG